MSLLDYWDTLRPSVKRRKTTADDTDDATSLSDAVTGRKDGIEIPETSVVNPDVSDIACIPFLGQEPEGDDLPFPGSQTELESSLPAIDTDSHAIEEYEASQSISDREEEPGLRERLQDGKWRKGKSSIYVDAFNLALETVLDEEAHLFDEAEMEVFKQWKELSYESQYLYVRLFLRKTSAWHRINRLGYYSDISDLTSAINDLQRTRILPINPPPATSTPIDTEHPETPKLTTQFHFADKTDQITTLEEASSLLLLDELKTLAKDAKVQGKSKKDLLTALNRASQQQTGLDWTSTGTNKASANRDTHFTQKILDYTGDCIRLAAAPRELFERVHLVFYRSTEWTEKSLTTIILAKISRRNFPEYVVCRSSSIFPSRAFLLEFESALRTQFDIDHILEFSGTPTVELLTQVRDHAYKVYPRWKKLCEQEQQKEDSVYECGEGAYLRRFSPAWVYTRIIHKGLYPLGRFKEYKEEHRLLCELLGQRLFHAARRGSWYQRKALLEEHYMWNLMSWEGRSEDAQRRHWRRIALQTCEEGLQDPDCHLIYHYDLQKRIMKLERALKVVKREQHDFSHVMLAKPEERTVEGIRIEREDTLAQEDMSRRGRATVWVDERDGGECRVESMCLSWYRDQGWKGYHSEGGIVRTLFGFLFYDILFTYVPNVFQTPFQTCPLDLHTDSFYATRASEINHRLVEITNGESERILRAVHACEAPRQPCAIGIDWTFELDDLVDIVRCFRGEALATICKVLAQEYQQRGGGIPDLFLWRVESREVMFVEVKSENDRLSDTQRLWIHVLGCAGVRVELCNAVAREVRYV
ncbi:VRR-NUC domain protein [Aspergillus parasiticus SU-1]|uniref:Fanconi-associated nuclease n=1 Tax=Aspergillus parasiticus (strain ATCC 56775 / NRRL 5862 / SRRC 143 / SU-1) TaxID=1403190 RepID=A0A0F0I6T6_ASPPU|nr:VRR-NUC domain protein [Aspergillus parasiticus SU-1]